MSLEQAEQVSVEDSILQAMAEIDEKNAPDNEPEEKADKSRDETGKFAKAPVKEDEAVEPVEAPVEEKPEVETPKTNAPQSWGAAVKAKWNDLPPEVQAEIQKRENDVHQMFTRHDGELKLGRDMKEIVSPYLPMIQAEGGTPATAVQGLLNTAYLLRTGTPERKLQLFQEMARTYGVPIEQVGNQQEQDPYAPILNPILSRIQGIEQQFMQQRDLQEQSENDKLQSEIQAFAAKNAHFETVKAVMAPLLASGQAKDLQEAYDAACWANPAIRSTLTAATAAEETEKRKAEVAKKKQASASITGSPGVKTPNSTTQKKSIEDDLSDVYDDIVGSKF